VEHHPYATECIYGCATEEVFPTSVHISFVTGKVGPLHKAWYKDFVENFLEGSKLQTHCASIPRNLYISPKVQNFN
jgi:hypothetical protein